MSNGYRELSVQTLPVQTQVIKVTDKQKGETKSSILPKQKYPLKKGLLVKDLHTYILKVEKVAVMAILANKNLRKKYVNLDKTKIATEVRKLVTNC